MAGIVGIPGRLHSEQVADIVGIRNLVENLGADRLLHGRYAHLSAGEAGPVVIVRVDGTAAYRIGDILRFTAARSNVHLFEADSGRRL